MTARVEVDIKEMRACPFASFESEPSVSPDFSEETLLVNHGAIDRHFSVADRGTMINILTHTDAFSIGSGILSPGFAGPELVSRPIRGEGKDIWLGWIQNQGTPLSDMGLSFIDELKRTLHSV